MATLFSNFQYQVKYTILLLGAAWKTIVFTTLSSDELKRKTDLYN